MQRRWLRTPSILYRVADVQSHRAIGSRTAEVDCPTRELRRFVPADGAAPTLSRLAQRVPRVRDASADGVATRQLHDRRARSGQLVAVGHGAL